jgi:hypothetical protein
VLAVEAELIDGPPNILVVGSVEKGRKLPKLPSPPLEVSGAPPNGLLEKAVDGAPKTLEETLCNPFADEPLAVAPGGVPNIVADG